MKSGTVKFFNAEKGYGFVCPDDSDEDLFVHVSKLLIAGLERLRPGQRVDFEPGVFKGRTQVESIQRRDEPDRVPKNAKSPGRRSRVDSGQGTEFRAVREYKEKLARGSFSSKSDFERSYDRMWRSIRDAK